MGIDRSDAFDLLQRHTQNENLIKHMLAVEAALIAYARKFDEDENLWGITGLLHDFDYEKHPTPDEHPKVGIGILGELGYPEALLHAIKAHAPYLGVPRESLLDKTLFACDELTGFVVAVALIRPSKSLSDLKVSSVTKKLNQAGFARAVSRSDIQQGAEELGVEFNDHIAFVIDAMKKISDRLDL